MTALWDVFYSLIKFVFWEPLFSVEVNQNKKNGSPNVTVRRCDYPESIYQEAPAEVLAVCCLYRHDVLDRMWNWCIASHDAFLWKVLTCNTHKVTMKMNSD